jgi:hypothetical protein
MTFVRHAAVIAVVAAAGAMFGCTTLLGDYTVGAGDDASAPSEGGSGDATVDAGDEGSTLEASTHDGTTGDDASDSGADTAQDTGITCTAGQSLCNGVCVPSDVHNCGRCGHDCTNLPHVGGATTCDPTAGKCAFPASACASGFADCNGNPDDGCEADLSQAGHCGTCTTMCSGGTPVCSTTGTTFACVSGCPAATPTLCAGACVNTTSNAQNCNGCGMACPAVTNAQATCTNSVCGFACNANYHVCNGACADSTSVNSCGTSCTPCQVANATPACTGGNCAIAMCNAGYADCDGNPATGCEASLNSPSHCGSCTNVCNLPNATAGCNGGTCVIAACQGGYADCNNIAADGCEKNLNTDPQNCGGCGRPCTGNQICGGGTCACPTGTTLCGGTCVNETSDANNCGACGHSCLGGTCSGGLCQPIVLYPTTTTNIEGVSVDSSSVYFSDGAGGHLFKCPLTGCSGNPTVLLSGMSYATAVYVDPSTSTVWVMDVNTQLIYARTTAGAAKYSFSIGGQSHAIVGDASFIYWGNNGTSIAEIDKLPKAGGSVTVNNANVFPTYAWDLALDTASGRIFAASNNATGQVASCPIAGGGCTNLSTYPNTVGVTANGGHIFFLVRGTSPNYTDGGVYTATTGLANYTVFASGAQYAGLNGNLVADANWVYWGSSNGHVWKCSNPSCAGGTATSISTSWGNYNNITQDSVSLYIASDGGLIRLPK